MAGPSPQRWATIRRVGVAAGLIAASVLTLVLVGAWTLSGAAPAWWRHHAVSSPDLLGRADEFERGAASALSRVWPAASGLRRGEPYRSDPWLVEFDDAAVSAWLVNRLPRWLEERDDLPPWPDDFSQMQVRFEPGRIRVGVRYSGDPAGAVVSATLRPEVRADGSFWLRPTVVHVGRLPLPPGLVLDRARRNAADIVPEELGGIDAGAAFLTAIAGESPVAEEALVALPDRRQVRLLDIRLGEGRAELLLQTESRGAAFTRR